MLPLTSSSTYASSFCAWSHSLTVLYTVALFFTDLNWAFRHRPRLVLICPADPAIRFVHGALLACSTCASRPLHVHGQAAVWMPANLCRLQLEAAHNVHAGLCQACVLHAHICTRGAAPVPHLSSCQNAVCAVVPWLTEFISNMFNRDKGAAAHTFQRNIEYTNRECHSLVCQCRPARQM